MKSVVHTAESRGSADFGWLKARQSFSFGRWFNPDKVHFGALRVLNDDYIAGGKGFDTHPHDNMEIITIPLEGELRHEDSMGHRAVIKAGDIQVMSAGTGIAHSEYNHLPDEPCKLLQLWIFPREKGVTPRYGDLTLDAVTMQGKWAQIVSPEQDDEGSWVHQDAWLHLGKFNEGTTTAYEIKKDSNGAYVFLIDGSIRVNNQNLSARDAIGIWETEKLDIEVSEDAYILIIDVPMTVSY